MEIPKYIVFRVDVMRKGTSVELTNITDEVEDVIFKADRKTDSDSEFPNNCEDCEHWNDTEDGCADRHGCKTEPQTESLEQFRVGLEYHTDTTHFGKVKGESITTNKVEDEPQTVRSNLEPFRVDEPQLEVKGSERLVKGKDEPQTEMTTEQVVNELLSIKKILDDGKLPKQRCGNCKHLTYRWNKTWCDIKCDNPHDMVCDKWERSE